MAFVTPVVEHWLEREIIQWVHNEGSIREPIAPWVNTLTTKLHLAPVSTEFIQSQCVLLNIAKTNQWVHHRKTILPWQWSSCILYKNLQILSVTDMGVGTGEEGGWVGCEYQSKRGMLMMSISYKADPPLCKQWLHCTAGQIPARTSCNLQTTPPPPSPTPPRRESQVCLSVEP